jgi:hypothetical protein
MGSNLTAVFTSCDRHDLLKETLDSFIRVQCGGSKPDRTIIIEDSAAAMPGWLRENIHYYSANLGKVEWVSNECRMGQIYSIDRAYAMVKTDYIFHCEDDWVFNLGGDWMVESRKILEKYPTILQVSLRGDTGWHQLIDQPPYEGFKICMPHWKGGWGGISFNPGLRRLSDYQRIGSYGKFTAYGSMGLGHEIDLSKRMLDLGYRMADLNRPIVAHTGGTRSRMRDAAIPMPKILIAIPVCHRYEYGKWESANSPSFNPANAYNGSAYGSDIHISGTNDRIAALRATWINDIKPFAAHVDYKFFYGAPHNRPAEPDEVFLGCEDDYAHLPHKTVEICKWAKANGYDWVFKCDDDTGLYIDRIIQELMTNRFDYGGYTNGKVCTGGTGYWLSKRAFTIIADFANANNHWAEDVTVGKTLFHHGIQPMHLEGHRTGCSDHWFYKNGFDPAVSMSQVSAFHAVRPEDMRAWYAAKEKK